MAKCKRPSCQNEAPSNPYRGKVPLYCGKKCRVVESVNTLRRKRKKDLVDSMGGCCSRCGYNKCLAALQFHHVDETTKDFEMSKYTTLSLDKVMKEKEKCILVCANCHAELHWFVPE